MHPPFPSSPLTLFPLWQLSVCSLFLWVQHVYLNQSLPFAFLFSIPYGTIKVQDHFVFNLAIASKFALFGEQNNIFYTIRLMKHALFLLNNP